MKKIISSIICLTMLLGVLSSFAVTSSAAAPYVTHTAPKSLKIGQAMPSFDITYHNLPANTKVLYSYSYFNPFDNPKLQNFYNIRFSQGGYGDGPYGMYTNEKGEYTWHFEYNPDMHVIATRAETIQYQPNYQLWDDEKGSPGNNPVVNVGAPIKLTIEQPVITHNAPQSIKKGQSIAFTTALTNTALKSVPISTYTSLDNTALPDSNNALTINPVYYIPVITIIQGKELITQSNQNYSQTQKSSENITFNKEGTVKLKITYKKYILASYNKNYIEKFDLIEDGSKNPEKIVTINVTDPNAPVTSTKPNEKPTNSSESTTTPTSNIPDESQTTPEQPPIIIEDEKMGIKISAPKDLLPDGTALKADIINGGEQFNKVTDALKEIAEKAVIYDLSLEKDGNKVTFDGKVSVSLPIPNGYEKSRLAVFYISDNGTKNEIPCSVNGDTVTFETDHFSVYALAEKTEEAAAANTVSTTETANTPVQKKSNTGLYIGLAVGGIILLAGAGFAVWYFKFRKKPDKAE